LGGFENKEIRLDGYRAYKTERSRFYPDDCKSLGSLIEFKLVLVWIGFDIGGGKARICNIQEIAFPNTSMFAGPAVEKSVVVSFLNFSFGVS
jgi:hypothetical protein